MKLTRDEVRELAKVLVNRVTVNIMSEHEGIQEAADKVGKGEWQETLDLSQDEIEEILLTKIDTRD